MKRTLWWTILLLLALAAPLAAQVTKRDPLTEAESDQLREVAMEPDKRLKLIIKFAQARLGSIDEINSAPKAAADRTQKIHDLLEDFGQIMDELDDNIDDYADRKADLRKPLKDVIEADTEFQSKLRALKESAKGELGDYGFVLQDSLDAVGSNLDNARQLLSQQEATFKAEKEKKKGK